MFICTEYDMLDEEAIKRYMRMPIEELEKEMLQEEAKERLRIGKCTLGLKTQESDKFKLFFQIVQQTAAKNNCVFFLDAGDGRDFETETLEGEDLMGWLIPREKVSEFEPLWKEDAVSDEWTDFFTWAIWSNDNGLTVKFEQ